MDLLSWLYLALAVLSLGGALLLSRLLPLSLTGGASVALLLSLLLDLWYLELILLVAVTGVLLLAFCFFPRRRETALEAMVGKSCTVTERIDPLNGGQVMVEGGLWAARALGEASLEVGTGVTVVAIEGVKLICR
jgi:membrane protein implicated in regulation of membrane protease activity